MFEDIKKRLYARRKITTKGCWLYTLRLRNDGYGRGIFRLNGKLKHYLIHRISYIVHVGSVPKNLKVVHTSHKICGNRHCFAPAHLSLATQYENCLQKQKDGTQTHSENHGAAKLTNKEVHEILWLLKNTDYSQTIIALNYGVSHRVISDIHRNRKWKNLQGGY